jgi:hypothetical protein
MPRIVPSQVVTFIDATGNFLATANYQSMTEIDIGRLSAILSLVEDVPQELIALDANSYALFTADQARVRNVLSRWEGGPMDQGPYLSHALYNAIAGIREALAKCPDQGPAPTTSELKFISDQNHGRPDEGSPARGRHGDDHSGRATAVENHRGSDRLDDEGRARAISIGRI